MNCTEWSLNVMRSTRNMFEINWWIVIDVWSALVSQIILTP